MTEDDDIIRTVLQRSLALNPGCCANDEMRGRLCPYHQGIEDGAEAALLEAKLRTTESRQRGTT